MQADPPPRNAQQTSLLLQSSGPSQLKAWPLSPGPPVQGALPQDDATTFPGTVITQQIVPSPMLQPGSRHESAAASASGALASFGGGAASIVGLVGGAGSGPASTSDVAGAKVFPPQLATKSAATTQSDARRRAIS